MSRPDEEEGDQVPQALDGRPSEPAVHVERSDRESAEADPSSSRPGAWPGFPGHPIDILPPAPVTAAPR